MVDKKMEGKTLIRRLCLRNFLSYGSEAEAISLQPLNVLIGRNASGKSNLIEAIGLLRATPKDFAAPLREGGGIREWIWKGDQSVPEAQIDAIVDYPDALQSLHYRICFTAVGQRMEITDEAIENELRTSPSEQDVYFFYRYQKGQPVLNLRERVEERAGSAAGRTKRYLRREDLNPEQSVLSQRKDPDQYPEITYLGNAFGDVRLFREWNLGRYTAPRVPQQADLPNDFVSESFNNLGLVLNDLWNRPPVKQLVLEKLKDFYSEAQDITTRIHGSTVQVFMHERGLNEPVPATRLSDGTLRYLCLLTILCHPTPPPLICIEEPELGLHPDIVPTIAELLIEASKRTQLIVTTHSEVLVSALSHVPETILVCERDSQGTHLRRLEPEPLKEWLEKYSLGELWAMGEIGGS